MARAVEVTQEGIEDGGDNTLLHQRQNTPNSAINGNSKKHARSMSTEGTPECSTFLRSLSHVRSVPTISMHCKLPSSFIEIKTTPSPDTYVLPRTEQLSKHSVAPRFGFGGAPRFSLGQPLGKQMPGPGAYDPKEHRYHSLVKFGFGTAPARGRPSPVRRSMPGPGAYKTKAVASEGSVVRFQGRAREPEPRSRSLPGPGTYNPSATSNFLHESTSKFVSSAKVGFGTSTREEICAKNENPVPGPGTYELKDYKAIGADSAKFSMSSRRQSHDLDSYLMPGPGKYNSHATSFGYTSTFVSNSSR